MVSDEKALPTNVRLWEIHVEALNLWEIHVEALNSGCSFYLGYNPQDPLESREHNNC